MSKTTLVRVLAQLTHEGFKYPPNTLLELAHDQAKALVEAGTVDDHKDAIAYLKTELRAPVVKHAATPTESDEA